MKNRIWGLFLVLIIIGSISCKQTLTSFSINGEIKGLKDGTKLNLILGATHKDEKPLAEAIIEDGKFQFTGKMDEPRYCIIMVDDSYGTIGLLVENADIMVNAEATGTATNDKTEYTYKSVQITGSKLQPLLEQKTAFRTDLDKLYETNNKKHEAISALIMSARASKNNARVDSLMASDEGKSMNADETAFFKEVDTKINHAILADKDSWWGPFLMLQNLSYFTKEQIPIYNQFSQVAKDSYYGKLVYAELFPPNLVSKSAPAFTLNDKDGKSYASADLMKGKKYILVDFWASWCGPCRREIPNVKHLYELYSPKGLQIISISTDKDKAAWMKALGEEKMPWSNLLNADSVADKYYVKAIPALFLVNDKGIVLSDSLRGEPLAKKLEELFK